MERWRELHVRTVCYLSKFRIPGSVGEQIARRKRRKW